MDFSTRFTLALRSLVSRLQTYLPRSCRPPATPALPLVPGAEHTTPPSSAKVACDDMPVLLPGTSVDIPAAIRMPRILLAEDTEINRQLVLLLLKKKGWIIDPVINGQLALDALAGTRYDLVLMDCMMPVMDGYEAVRQLREREAATGCRRVPVIGMTASVTEGDRERCFAAGMDDYLAKPFTASALGTMAERWRLRDGA